MKKRVRAILIDVLGFTLILAAIPLGWLPGPGGIPLVILGLSLLANNHEWAERLMNKVKAESGSMFQKVFNGSARSKWIIDISSVVLISVAVLLIVQLTRSIARTAAVSLIIAGIFLLLSNRRRYHALWHKITRTRHKH